MPTCPRCGKVNIKDAQFCQECGYRLAPAPAAAPADAAKPAAPAEAPKK